MVKCMKCILYWGCRCKWILITTVNFQFKQYYWKEEAWKISRLQRGSNLWPSQYWCDAWPIELWSHTLGARSICWVHVFQCSEMMSNIIYMKYMWNNYICHWSPDICQASCFQLLKLEIYCDDHSSLLIYLLLILLF